MQAEIALQGDFWRDSVKGGLPKAFFNSFEYNSSLSNFYKCGPVGELAETTSLLRTRSRKVTEGSNPSLSAMI